MTTCAGRHRTRVLAAGVATLALAAGLMGLGRADAPRIRPAAPNVMSFEQQAARYVRLVIRRSHEGAACIDELEVYGPGDGRNLALAGSGAVASASSCIEGFAIHRVEHLNDGRYGNAHSWIAGHETEPWVQIALPAPELIDRVVFSRDRGGEFADRLPLDVEALLSDDGRNWTSVARLQGEPAVGQAGAPTVSVSFRQEHARWVELRVLGTEGDGPPRLEEIEVYGAAPGVNLALAANGARTAVSSGASRAAALNDARLDGEAPWVADGPARQWVRIELPRRVEVNRVAFSRDRSGERSDGLPTVFEVRISLDGKRWKTLAERGRPAIPASPGLDDAAEPVAEGASVPRSDARGFTNLALLPGARAGASSSDRRYPGQHELAHLNDGRYGNTRSWLSEGEPSWVQVDLGAPQWVTAVAFGTDSTGRFVDRAATEYRVLLADRYDPRPGAPVWRVVAAGSRPDGVRRRMEMRFPPARARWARVEVSATTDGALRIDELEVYGAREPISAAAAGPVTPYPPPEPGGPYQAALREAFLGDEYASLKIAGRADLDAALTGYVRVWEFPQHRGTDTLPLPPVVGALRLDGRLDDDVWAACSRGVVRVASPDAFHQSPLVEQALSVGVQGDDLLLGIRADRLLSSHVAVLSTTAWRGAGVLALRGRGLEFRPAAGPDEKRAAVPVPGGVSADRRIVEARVPLALLPGWRSHGVRVGLGLGGRHASELGQPVVLWPSRLSVAEVGPAGAGRFRVRLAAAPGGGALTVTGDVPALASGLRVAPGRPVTVEAPARPGPVGPERSLSLREAGGPAYALHLLRYDPVGRTLHMADGIAARLGARGVDVRSERAELRRLRRAAALRLASGAPQGTAEERAALWQARLFKRRLFLRAPDLAAARRILCVKRHSFEPSHNYSDLLDAVGGVGGGVDLVEIPRVGGRLEPERATVRRIFDSKDGIARDAAASFDARTVYFAYSPGRGQRFRLMRLSAAGGPATPITDGAFDDLYPCPLPDGGLAFISTRCRQRFLCWRPEAYVLYRMDAQGRNIRPLSFANLSEWAPAVTRHGLLIWTRSEYQDKGADFSHTLWTIRPDGSHPELVFGNTIIQPNGYANGREVPGTSEIVCTLISHFGDLNGPIALIDTTRGRFNAGAIRSLTPEVPWPGHWPAEECFRDPYPLGRDYFLCSHAPRRRFGIYVIDRWGNRELLHTDPQFSAMCPTPLRPRPTPPIMMAENPTGADEGEFIMADVYAGLGPSVPRGSVRWLRIAQEVRAPLERLPSGEYRTDHPDFENWYATPTHLVSGPYGWPSYVAKASWGLVPVQPDGSARFTAPARRVLYFSALDDRFTEVQRMRSVVQLQPGERRGCIGCHEPREAAPSPGRRPLASAATRPTMAEWEGRPFDYERVVQPVLDRRCAGCHDGRPSSRLNLTGASDESRVPASYRALVGQGWVHYFDWSYNPGGNEKAEPKTFGNRRSRLWQVLDAGHYGVELTRDEELRLKTWVDLNCPLWPDYRHRLSRPLATGR
ncbi:MAG TPA: discoidin domain-containing protein [Chthonomonadales bacterium]|nr:discoidin domain-containing protein [Chthonomonadales bacterium]